MKYKYYVGKDVVVCTTRFAGKNVRATAKCSEGDTFDEEVGKNLAKLRCDIKVAKKRAKLANSKYSSALHQLLLAKVQVDKMYCYLSDSNKALESIKKELHELEESLK